MPSVSHDNFFHLFRLISDLSAGCCRFFEVTDYTMALLLNDGVPRLLCEGFAMRYVLQEGCKACPKALMHTFSGVQVSRLDFLPILCAGIGSSFSKFTGRFT